MEGEVEAVEAEAEAPAASDTPGEEATQEAAVADGGPTLEDVDTPSYSPAKVQRANRRTPKKDKEEEPAPANEDEIEAVESAEPEPSNGKRASKKRPKRSTGQRIARGAEDSWVPRSPYSIEQRNMGAHRRRQSGQTEFHFRPPATLRQTMGDA